MRFTISAINGQYVARAVDLIRKSSTTPVWIWNSGANEGEVWADIRVGTWSQAELLKQLRDTGRITVDQYEELDPVIEMWGEVSFQSLLAESFEGA